MGVVKNRLVWRESCGRWHLLGWSVVPYVLVETLELFHYPGVEFVSLRE